MGQLVEYVRASQSAKSFRVHRRFVGEIIEIVRPSLFVFIAARCAPDQAEDVLQDTLVVIATKLAGFQCEADAQVWAWCYKIAANKLKQCHQQTQRHPRNRWTLRKSTGWWKRWRRRSRCRTGCAWIWRTP